ncbi:hypothetical protein RHGRI_025624 [Rhododendron griersonianum]|uniref:NADP-dependent oxidoreductase domain-containing protein n=1 Tax=Rhododendron griersonianum TaxID=479676 RepID=A0AAV6IT60_9ERIC|nr:hypothetical protein RHGRI_025624 [Rhododendron griersonianum]KAG5530715.1 hypothetical protein RHGRI_025624 [Rhododendron griersonianum]
MASQSIIPEVTLSSGQEMPVLGLGTATSPPVAPEIAVQAVVQAIELGYRHFDTASLYQTESTLGDAVQEAIRVGLIKSREEVFLTSKLWCSDAHPHLVVPALQTTLRNLKTEYLDLYLIHWPLSMKHGIIEFPPKPEDFLPLDIKSVWAEMEECQRQGLTKSIGVSNFSSFSPLGAAGTPWGHNRVMESEICLRWGYEQGIGVVMKSFNKERLQQNLAIFDWALSDEDCKKIGKIPQRRGTTAKEFIDGNGNGPFKSIDELWDGEI